MLSRMSVTMILLVFFLLPLQEEETDGSEEAKETWVSGRPMRHVPFDSSLLVCTSFNRRKSRLCADLGWRGVWR